MNSETLRNTIIKYRNEGQKFKKISENLNMRESQVKHIFYYEKKKMKCKTGPKRKIDKRASLSIKRFISKSNLDGRKVNCSKIIQDMGISIARRTLNSWLLAKDYRYSSIVQKICISDKHKKRRVELVSQWIEENMSWEKTFFSDEKRFSLDGPDNWYFLMLYFFLIHWLYFRKTYTNKKFKIIRQRRQMGGGSIMFWGMIMPNGLIAIREVNGTLNSDSYIELLKTFAVPCMKLNSNDTFNFVQDNCPSHVSKRTMDYLNNQEFKTIQWPSRSPDINIMENVWKMMCDIIYEESQPRNKTELREMIHKSVFDINMNRIESMRELYTSYRRRLTKVLNKHGNLIN